MGNCSKDSGVGLVYMAADICVSPIPSPIIKMMAGGASLTLATSSSQSVVAVSGVLHVLNPPKMSSSNKIKQVGCTSMLALWLLLQFNVSNY